MVVYSSVQVPGTEFIALNGTLPSCLNGTEPHVVGSNNSVLVMRPAVVKKGGSFICANTYDPYNIDPFLRRITSCMWWG